MKKLIICILVCLPVCLSSAQDNTLTRKEKKAGWILLFDGKTLDGWRAAGEAELPATAGWSVEDNCLKAEWNKSGSNKNIVTKGEFADFEIYMEWKLAPAANSGIIYHYGDKFTKAPPCSGPEYQIIDDLGWPVPLTEDHFTGVDYELHTVVTNKELKPVGEWNSSKIVFKKGHVEHWLNGKKILEFEAWTPDWYERLAKTRYGQSACYGENRSGAFMLQNYRDCKLWFKNIKVKPIK